MTDPSPLLGGTWSELKVDPWLAGKGFHGNPFERWNAETDPNLPSYYVDLGEFDLLQRLTQPCVVLARRGCGKTAQRQMLAADYRPLDPHSKWLAVPYTYAGFEHVLRAVEYDVARVQARHHVEAILYQGLTALNREAQRNEAIGQALVASDSTGQWAAYATSFAPHLLPDPYPGDVRFLDALSSPELLSGFAGLVRAAGLEACAILVDGLDEFLLTAGDLEQAVSFVAPLLSTLELIEQPGLAFKFFLPQRMGPDLLARGWFRKDRIRVFRITWTRQQIDEMFAQRLVYFSAPETEYGDIARLCDDKLGFVIKEEIALLAEGSPRTALRLASRLLRVHCRQEAPPDLIARDTWEQVKEAWLAEHGFPVLCVDKDQKSVLLNQLEISDEFSRQVYLVLESLYHHRDQVCAKDTLIEEAWEGGTATDEMLAQSISRLRRTLEKYVPDAEYVETVRGIGFRLHSRGRLKTGQAYDR